MKPLDSQEVLLLTATQARARATVERDNRLSAWRSQASRYRLLEASITLAMCLPFGYATGVWIVQFVLGN